MYLEKGGKILVAVLSNRRSGKSRERHVEKKEEVDEPHSSYPQLEQLTAVANSFDLAFLIQVATDDWIAVIPLEIVGNDRDGGLILRVRVGLIAIVLTI